jgi:hypothetical protein
MAGIVLQKLKIQDVSISLKSENGAPRGHSRKVGVSSGLTVI